MAEIKNIGIMTKENKTLAIMGLTDRVFEFTWYSIIRKEDKEIQKGIKDYTYCRNKMKDIGFSNQSIREKDIQFKYQFKKNGYEVPKLK